jgi:hypothetical protein
MPSIISKELIELLRQLLLPLPRKLWYAVNITDAFEHNLHLAISLNEFQYETILLESCILKKRGEATIFSQPHLDYLKQALKTDFDLHITRSKIQRNGKPMFFIAVDAPRFHNPSTQAKENTGIRPN